jgi:interleukin-like EMT inducer protein
VRDSSPDASARSPPVPRTRESPVKDDNCIEDPRVTPSTAREAYGPGRQAAVYAVFVLLVLVYTWPLATNLSAHLRDFFDVRYFVWELGWVARRAFASPRTLFDANIFYPYGLPLAYSEPMLIPAITVFAPVYGISGNPILAYNVTVVLFQALAGWAGYHAARRLTGSAAAGWVAGITFALSPIRSGYYHFAHMQLSFAVPLAFVAWARYLERRRGRDLAWALFFVWCQMVTVMYFGIPLILLLALLTAGVLLLRPQMWSPRALLALAVGGAVFALAYLPVAWPYLMVRSEMGFERGLAEATERTADLLTYLDAGRENRLYLYRLATSGTHPAMFPGFCVYALLVAAFVLASRHPRPPLPTAGVWGRRLVGWGLVVTLATIAIFLVTGGGTLRPFGVRLRMTSFARPAMLLLVLGAAWLMLEGWAWRRAGDERTLSPREWTMLLGLLAVVFILLSLGPVMHLGGRDVGVGLYAWVYDLYPPIRALRVTHRLGFTVMFLLGLLAAFGLAAVQARLSGSRVRHAMAVAPLLLLVEYLPTPFQYDVVRWDAPPPVYQWLARQPGDIVVAEWPAGHELPDATFGMWSLLHGKRLVNGSSGFDPPLTQEIREALARLPETGVPAILRSVYPLRFLLVHLESFPRAEERASWERVAGSPPPGLTVVGRFADSVVFELDAQPERGQRWERTFSTTLVKANPRARVSVALAREDPEIDLSVDVDFNGRRLTRVMPGVAPTDLAISLPPPYPKVERNVLSLELTYRLLPQVAAGAGYLIGSTGMHSPVDLAVTSAGKEHGWIASIKVNGVEVARHFRGYNVAVLDPRSGAVEGGDVFDTFASRAESARLADFIARIPPGRIAVAAIQDDGVGQLGDDAVQAFRSLGGRLDPRGTLFVSHLLIGVKGAAPGTAIEAFGPARLTRLIGRDRGDLLITRDFRLE